MSTSSNDRRGVGSKAVQEPGGLVWEVTATEDGVELTMYPPNATGLDLMTRWLTAAEGSWVSLVDRQ